MQNVPEKRQGTLVWIGQAVSGLLLLGLLGLHMIAHHFIVEGGLRDYQQVLDYVGSPAILVIELVFLVVVTYHAMIGVRSIIFDLGLEPGQERSVTSVLTVIGAIIIVYGFYLAITLFSRA
jgi:succinate dehydrogenase cytochrome b556 subunit